MLWGCLCLVKRQYNRKSKKEIIKIKDSIDFLSTTLSKIEINRLRLYQGLNEHKVDLNRLEADLSKLAAERQELFDTAESRLKDLNKLAAEGKNF